MKFIPLPASAGIVGFESPAAEYVDMKLSLDELLIKHPSATYFGLAKGESMIGHGIFDGDLLVVSRAEEDIDRSVIVGTLNGEFICKELDKEKRLLTSSAEGVMPRYITEDDDFRVEGVVICSIRIFKKLAIFL